MQRRQRMPTMPSNQANADRTRELIEESAKCCTEMVDSKARIEELIAATRQVLAESLRTLAAASKRTKQQ